MRPLLKPLAQQVIVITGASSGIGLATARKAVEAGAKVVLVARGEAALKAVVEGFLAAGGRATYAIADVGDLEQVQAAADHAIQVFGRIDTWVSNAGVAIYADLLTTPRDEHERLFRTNYWGAVNSAQVAVAAMERQGGALVIVGSIASDMGSPVMGAYAATKHAVKGYIDSLRLELRRDGVPVQVSLIKPAGIGTPLNTHVANHKAGEAQIPPPVYAPELVADVILHAATHPVREQIVGGAGAAQVMIATHFPGLFARVAGAITPLLNDPEAPATSSSNLFQPHSGGEARGGQRSRPFSLYTAAHLHPAAVVGLSALMAAMLTAAASVRRERTKSEG